MITETPFAEPPRRPTVHGHWHQPLPYGGPERRQASLTMARLLAQVLDEIDYGLILLADARQVLHVNHAARAELGEDHPLQLLGGELRARVAKDVAPLFDAVNVAATKGLRRMLSIGEGAQRIGVSVVPLGGLALESTEPAGALLVLGRRQVCGALSIHGFARAHGLSDHEERVLRQLCDGLTPTEIADRHGVKIATVRTQIACIRAKTDAPSIRDLVQSVAMLPPMMSSLRGFAAVADAVALLSVRAA